MLQIALWEPEIPPNTGNIARLCVASGTMLHLVGRVAFRLDEQSLRRAGVDCWDELKWKRHASLAALESALPGQRLLAFSARAERRYTDVAYQNNDCLLFGCESYGLPVDWMERHREDVFSIPMPAGKTRSLNLATAVGIVLYEALRQLDAW